MITDSAAIIENSDLTREKKRKKIRLNKQTNHQKTPLPDLTHFTDKVLLTGQQIEDEKNKKKKKEITEQQQSQLSPKKNTKKTLTHNDLKELMRYFSQKINFKKKLPEFKEMYQFNLIQAKSANTFVAAFSSFKVGVVGQILALMGVPINQIKQLKKQALTKLFEENIMQMQENISKMLGDDL